MRTTLAVLAGLPLLAGLAACGSPDRPAHSAEPATDTGATGAVTGAAPFSANAGTSTSVPAAPDRMVAGASLRPAAPMPVATPTPTREVNPLTGMPLSLEEMHWTLEQAHLEEQLQASLLNRRKFEIERQHLDASGGTVDGIGGALPMLQTPGSGVAAPAGHPDGPAGRSPGGTSAISQISAGPAIDTGPASSISAQEAPRRRLPAEQRAAPAISSPDRWTVVGVRAQGSAWCLLFVDGEQLSPACPGEMRQGHHVDAVSAQGYTVDGRSFLVNIPVARVRRGGAAAVAPEGGAATAAGDAGVPIAVDGPAAPAALAAGLPAPDRWPLPAGSDASTHAAHALVSSQPQPH